PCDRLQPSHIHIDCKKSWDDGGHTATCECKDNTEHCVLERRRLRKCYGQNEQGHNKQHPKSIGCDFLPRRRSDVTRGIGRSRCIVESRNCTHSRTDEQGHNKQHPKSISYAFLPKRRRDVARDITRRRGCTHSQTPVQHLHYLL